MASGRRKAHHTHEVGDAYAEGWTARLRWCGFSDQPVNPYQRLVLAANTAKQSTARRATQRREVEQWDAGWADCAVDMRLNDLAEVTESDFRAPLHTTRESLDLPEDDD